jgi:hypothetical protein
MENTMRNDLSFDVFTSDSYKIEVRPRNNTSYFIENDNDIQEVYINSNSPLSMSENNSENNSDDEELQLIRNERIQHQFLHTLNKSTSDSLLKSLDDIASEGAGVVTVTPNHEFMGKRCKKKHFHDIEKSLKKYYEYDNKYSNKLDILITYTKGQKNIFIQSNYLTHKKFVFLMIPAILFSATVAILSPSIQEYKWSGGFICALNILITSILSILNYTKYELFAEKYLQLANQYDKIEFSLEMTNSKLVFIDSEEEKNKIVLEKLKEIEVRLNELKALYNIIIPEVIHNIFPIICSINIFSLIKKIDLHKQELIHKLKDIKNEIEFILYKWKNIDSNHAAQLKDKNRLLFLYDIKEKIKIELQQFTHIYDFIDRLFIKEINESVQYKKLYYLFFSVHKKININKENMHPLLEKYMDSIFYEPLMN